MPISSFNTTMQICASNLTLLYIAYVSLKPSHFKNEHNSKIAYLFRLPVSMH